MYIDPSFTWYQADGADQSYDPVQSGCPTASHYNDSSDYPTLPVGDDQWEGCAGHFGYDFSYYQVRVPSVIWGSNINSATFQDDRYYASACQSAWVTLSLTAAIGSGTDWNNKPAVASNLDSADTGYTKGDCGTTGNDGVGQGESWNILSAVKTAASSKWSQMTFRLWEDGNCPGSCDGGNGDTDKNDMRRFGPNAQIQVLYNDTPEVPGALKATATSDGTGSVGCDTNASDASMPMMGRTASVHGPYLWATYNDADTDEVQSTIQYWNNASPSTVATISAGSSLSTGAKPVAAQMPASFTASLPVGSIIGWRADASDGHFTSAWSAKCYFKVDPTNPDPPAVSAVAPESNCPSGGTVIAPGCQIQITITATNQSADPASKFIWGLDQVPPTSGTIPAAQQCTTSAATANCSKITTGVATLTVTVPSPGPHDLWVYELDAAGNESGMTNGAPEDSTVTFTAAADAATSYTSGGSLAANFASALTAGAEFDNSMISDGSTACGGAADGETDAISSTGLVAAGWKPGGSVTVDGASFTLPSFGTCGADNVLAANQTLGTGSSGVQASSLVFLATGTNAFAQVPGTVSGAPDSGLLTGDPTAPAVAGGTPVVGAGCDGVILFDHAQGGCGPATGTISYSGAACSATPTAPYSLTVPDWVQGPSDITAVSVPKEVVGTSTTSANTNVFAFSVPVNPACTVTSVSLPDVGADVAYQIASGVAVPLPGLHILGVAFRNTTTATPVQPAAASQVTTPCAGSCTTPSGQAWTGAFAAPTEDSFAPASGSWGNQSIRMAVTPTVTAAAGAQLRIRLSDPGFLAGDGSGPLVIGAAMSPAAAGGHPQPGTVGPHLRRRHVRHHPRGRRRVLGPADTAVRGHGRPATPGQPVAQQHFGAAATWRLVVQRGHAVGERGGQRQRHRRPDRHPVYRQRVRQFRVGVPADRPGHHHRGRSVQPRSAHRRGGR